jgi:hypothetical protein
MAATPSGAEHRGLGAHRDGRFYPSSLSPISLETGTRRRQGRPQAVARRGS